MTVDRCICFNITFEELKAYAQQHEGGLSALQARFGCGRSCALCVPYIHAMLKNGQTTFDHMDPPPALPDQSHLR